MLIILRLDSGAQLYICSYPIYRDYINVIFQGFIAHGIKFADETQRKKVAESAIFATYVHTKQYFTVSDIKSPSDKCFNRSLDLINEDNLVHGSILSPNNHPHGSRICFKNNEFRSSFESTCKSCLFAIWTVQLTGRNISLLNHLLGNATELITFLLCTAAEI